MSKILNEMWVMWSFICTWGVTILFLMVVIFGGSFSVKVNFHSVTELITSIKNYLS